MPSHVWVEDTPALEAAIARLKDAPYVGVDTEADSRHHYPEKTCLIQIGSGDEVFIVDPLADVEVGLLGPLLSDQAVQKLFHGADFDLRGLNRDWGFEVHNVYDTNVSARFAPTCLSTTTLRRILPALSQQAWNTIRSERERSPLPNRAHSPSPVLACCR